MKQFSGLLRVLFLALFTTAFVPALTMVLTLVLTLGMSSGAASAQGTNIAFGALSHDTSLPVEITADQLDINQADGTASFTGNVIIGQGEMRLSAGAVHVEYGNDGGDATGEISKLVASGGVTLVNGSEAAEAQDATYTLATGIVVMQGGVILTQGRNALSAERLVIDLVAGTGRMEGRVKTILQAGGN